MASPLARDAPTFSDLKLKALAAPNLEVGDSLEYQVTHVTRVPLKPGDFWVIYFPNRQTVVETEVVVLNVPAGRNLTLKTHPEYQAAYSEQEHGGRKIYRWQFSNPHPVKSEEGPVKPLFAASTLDDWKQVGEWYMQLQAGRTQVTPEIQALVAKLTAGKTTPREKLDAIYTYVSESIRYVAIHFGIGGFQAHAAADVLRNGYGDCKDKHGLLSAMLDAAGMKAYPVLANSQQGVIELDVPMPAQFDHVVSVVPVNGQKVWLDTTLEFAPPGFMPASMRGKQALLIDLSATRLAEIPKEPAVPENAHLTSQGRLDPLGKLSLENHFEMRGSMEVLYRKVFRTGNKDAILEVIKALGLLEIEGATTEELKSSDPTDLSQPFDVKYRLTDINFFGPGEKMKVVEVPIVFTDRFQGHSKMSGHIVSEALFMVLRLLFQNGMRRRPRP